MAATDSGSTVAAKSSLEVAPAGHAALCPLSPRPPALAAIAIRKRNPVHLRRERPEALLVRHHLGGERQGQVGSAVKAVLEADHRLPAGEGSRHLDGILHRLRAAVDEEGPLLVRPGRDPIEPLGQLDVRLVGGDREADVGEPVELLPHRRDHARCRCPVFTTPMPPPKSMKRLPSASVRTAPSACTIAIGVTAGTPRGTAWARRARSARLLGPGISVRSWMTPGIGILGGAIRRESVRDSVTRWKE